MCESARGVESNIDSHGRLEGIAHATSGAVDLLSLVYQFDAAGSITDRTETGTLGGAAEAYTYDTIDQLTGVTKNLVAAETFTYDATGNRVFSQPGPASASVLRTTGFLDLAVYCLS